MRRPAPLPTPADRPAEERTARDRSAGDRVLPESRVPLRIPAPDPRVSATDAPRPGERRPSSGAPPAPAGPPSAPSADGAPVIAPEWAETVPLDPLPLRAVGDGAATEAVDPPTGARAAESADDEDETLGARDLWRATRARRRVLRSEIRRFTGRARRRRWTWIGALSAVVLLVLGSIGIAYSPLFAVERITVEGAATIDPSLIEGALADQVGRPLALVDQSAVKAALLAFPLIETYALEARPPHDLTVRIVERTPVGVFASPAGYTLVDAAGVTLATTPEIPPGQPLLEIAGGTGSAAFASAGRVIRSLPAEVRAQVTGVAAGTADDVTLTLAGGATVLWGSADQSAHKGLVLAQVMQARPPGDASFYDVSSPEAVVVG